MTTINRDEPFPLDWDEWRRLWDAWKFDVRDHLGPSSYRFPRQRNFMADEVLGVWSINGRSVELSEVTFPALGERPRRVERLVGITFAGSGGDERNTDIVRTFAELEDALGIDTMPSRWRTEVVFDGALEDTDNYDTREQAQVRFREHLDELHRDYSASHWRVDIYDEGDGLNPGQPVESFVNDPEEERA